MHGLAMGAGVGCVWMSVIQWDGLGVAVVSFVVDKRNLPHSPCSSLAFIKLITLIKKANAYRLAGNFLC
jgi:hypothetical protein